MNVAAKIVRQYSLEEGCAHAQQLVPTDAAGIAQAPEAKLATSINRKVGVGIGPPNIYVAVFVAAFGGLKVHVDHGVEAVKVFPVIVWFLTIPVFLAQVSALLYLKTYLQFEGPVYKSDDQDAVLQLELLLVVIVYVANFKVLLVSLQHCVFILNPLTWVEVQHADAASWLEKGSRFMTLVHLTCVVPWPFIALSMNIFVNYTVCKDSVSLILSTDQPSDAIFNSLAITFIVELDDLWWAVCEDVFKFEMPTEFEFVLREEQVWDDVQKRGTLLKDRKKEMGWFGTWVETFAFLTSFPFLPKRFQLEQSIFRVNHGARRLTQLVVLFGLFLIFLRQLLVVLEAVDTNVLPMARDLCTVIDWREGYWSSKFWNGFEPLLFVNVNEKLAELGRKSYELPQFGNKNVTMESACDAEWKTMELRQQFDYASENWGVVVIFSMLMFLILGLPALARDLHNKFFHRTSNETIETSSLLRLLEKDYNLEEAEEMSGWREVAQRLTEGLKKATDRIQELEKQLAAGARVNPP